MIFDITTKDATYKTIHTMLDINKDAISSFIDSKLKKDGVIVDFSEGTGENLISSLDIDISTIDLRDIELVSIHYTSNTDNNAFLLKHGIRDLKHVLEYDSPLKEFLKENNITFDISNNSMKIDGIDYSGTVE